MKKHKLTIALFLISLNSIFAADFALDKRSKMLSGNFSISTMGGELYEDQREERLLTILASPRYSYFISNNLAFGAELSLTLLSQGDQSIYWKILNWKIGPRMTYFFRLNEKSPDLSYNKLNPYVTLGIFYKEISSEEKNDNQNESSLTGYSIDFGLGTLFMLGNSVGISTEISYSMEELKNTSGNNIQFLIGINVFDF